MSKPCPTTDGGDSKACAKSEASSGVKFPCTGGCGKAYDFAHEGWACYDCKQGYKDKMTPLQWVTWKYNYIKAYGDNDGPMELPEQCPSKGDNPYIVVYGETKIAFPWGVPGTGDIKLAQILKYPPGGEVIMTVPCPHGCLQSCKSPYKLTDDGQCRACERTVPMFG